MRNGTWTKTVLTEIGSVEIEVPGDRDGFFEPVIVLKRKRRLDGVDQVVLLLAARGLMIGEIVAYFGEVYGVKVLRGHDQLDLGESCRGVRGMGIPSVGPVVSGDLC